MLDAIPEAGVPIYERRRALLEALLPWNGVFAGDTSRPVPANAATVSPSLRTETQTDALNFYLRLKSRESSIGVRFFEGVVMKRADSPYPVQLRRAKEEFRCWVKHRFFR